jgi:tRNA pseudouridine-54 N-methylase
MERRTDGPRLALEATALITVDVLSPAIHSRIVNASQRGMQLVMPDSRPVGTRIRVTVRIEEPQREITVSGIIVHTTTMESVDPRLTSRIGIFLTETGDDWRSLCECLAQLAPKCAR